MCRALVLLALSITCPLRVWAQTLPSGPVDRAAVDGLRFTLAFRGYRMSEVDDVLDRLLVEIDERDRRIAELEGRTWPSSS